MQIDTNLDRELAKNHPITCELTDEEAALYWSSIEIMAEAAEISSTHEARYAHGDFENSDHAEAISEIHDAAVLRDLIEEVAVWRLAEGAPSKVKKQNTNSSARTSGSDGDEEGSYE
jgi:hypothetical protein